MPKLFLFLICLALVGLPADRAESRDFAAMSGLTYADRADLALGAQIIAVARIDRAQRLDKERAIGVAPGHVRFYVEAELASLIRSAEGLPARVSYLVDMPLDANGRQPRIRDKKVILLANTVPGRQGELQLAAPDAQIDWSAADEQAIRAILAEAASDDAPGVIIGVGSAFSVPGTFPGESKTQIFLATREGRPVSLSILWHPNRPPRWTVSLGEVIERDSPPPQRESLLWYRLACFLPDQLPGNSIEHLDQDQISVAKAVYRLVMQDLGPCLRNRDKN